MNLEQERRCVNVVIFVIKFVNSVKIIKEGTLVFYENKGVFPIGTVFAHADTAGEKTRMLCGLRRIVSALSAVWAKKAPDVEQMNLKSLHWGLWPLKKIILHEACSSSRATEIKRVRHFFKVD